MTDFVSQQFLVSLPLASYRSPEVPLVNFLSIASPDIPQSTSELEHLTIKIRLAKYWQKIRFLKRGCYKTFPLSLHYPFSG